MSKHAYGAVIALGLILTEAASSASPKELLGCVRQSDDRSCSLYEVSLVQLIANPAEWDGKRVMVSGYLHLEFEGNALHLHRDDHVYQMAAERV